MDVRAGGTWRHTMHGPYGRDYPNQVACANVIEPELLAWAHDDASGGEPMFHVTVRLEAPGERTLVTMRHVFASAAARDADIEAHGSVQGAIEHTDRLAGHLVTMPGERDVVIWRDHAHPRKRVWSAWTDMRHLARWWGPAVFRNSVCEAELRVGGRYALTMTGPYPGPADSDYPVDGEYLEIVEPERLVMTVDCARHPPWWHDAVKPGRAADERNPAGTMLQTVTLQALTPECTRLKVRTGMASAEILASMKRIGMHEGWSESLERLGAELNSLAA